MVQGKNGRQRELSFSHVVARGLANFGVGEIIENVIANLEAEAHEFAEAAGAETAMFHTCHNVSRQELESGATYVSLMEGNLKTLRMYMEK